MNKIIYTFIIIFTSLFYFTSCESEETRINKLTQEYIDACAENDFNKAHSILDKMDIDLSNWSMIEHKKYVNKKEILYLIAQNDKQSANRLLFLIKESDTIFVNQNEIVNLAITQENEYLANKIVDTGKGVSKANVEAAVSADMEKLVIKMLKGKPELLNNSIVSSYLKTKDGKLLEDIQIFDLDSRIEKIMAFEFRGVPMANGCRDYDYDGESKHNRYRESVEKYNRLLDNALNLAINYENKKYAQKLLNMYKSMPSNAENGGIYRERGANLDVPITYSNAPYIDAQKRYNEALKAGLLK